MQTELLIARLARQAEPVRVLPPPRALLRRWAVVALLSVVVGLAWFGVRGDAAARVGSPDFLTQALLAIALATVAAHHALSSSVPGGDPHGVQRAMPLLLLAIWAAALAWPILGPSLAERLGAVRWHPACAWQMAAVAVVPAAWMFRHIGRAAPYALGWTSLQAALAAAGAGAVAVQGICGLDGAGHQVLWHVVPLLVISGATGLAGRRLLRRHRA